MCIDMNFGLSQSDLKLGICCSGTWYLLQMCRGATSSGLSQEMGWAMCLCITLAAAAAEENSLSKLHSAEAVPSLKLPVMIRAQEACLPQVEGPPRE